mmetsp:Transcript_28144/g.64713  ORF Transcript_28144/g.64713 Transcript_28144/m.64713 type:complete len:230 (-) Transcript_28144:658-1347(-)
MWMKVWSSLRYALLCGSQPNPHPSLLATAPGKPPRPAPPPTLPYAEAKEPPGPGGSPPRPLRKHFPGVLGFELLPGLPPAAALSDSIPDSVPVFGPHRLFPDSLAPGDSDKSVATPLSVDAARSVTVPKSVTDPTSVTTVSESDSSPGFRYPPDPKPPLPVTNPPPPVTATTAPTKERHSPRSRAWSIHPPDSLPDSRTLPYSPELPSRTLPDFPGLASQTLPYSRCLR